MGAEAAGLIVSSIQAPVAELIATTARDLRSVGHGEKGRLLSDICAATGQSRATVYRQLRRLSVRDERSRRSDAGTTSLTREEAQLLSALLMESHRKNGKRLMTVEHALEVLRYEQRVRAERVDPSTGEVQPMSAAAVDRALRLYGMHPQQLLAPAPATELRSLHPNHVWQIDASLCVLYYLHAGTRGGLQALPADRFYKNKPAALARVESERVWRYVVTDHFSGSLFVHYVLGAESGINLADAFIAAIVQRAPAGEPDPFHGVPLLLMMDMGSANTSGLFRNLARRLQVKLLPHAPGNARATGQVEKAQDIVERRFESALKFQPVGCLEELNDSASCWSRHFNATAIHSRHGCTRTDVWLRITAGQLRIAPPAAVCRDLLTHEPEERKVSAQLSVQFGGREYDVRQVPGVIVGAKLPIAINPYQADAACVVLHDEDGNELLQAVPEVARNDAGFRVDAPVIDEGYRRIADTPADTHRKIVERIAMQAQSDADAAEARKTRVLPFGGSIDPLRQAREAELPTAIPRRGEALELGARVAASQPQPTLIDAVTAMLRIVAAIGRHLSPEEHAFLAARYAEGVSEDQLDALIEQFTQPAEAPVRAAGGALRAV